MQSQTHVLLALALLSKIDARRRNLTIFVGALIPDAFTYVAWAYYTLNGNSQTHIRDVLYFQNPTQFWDALFNSIPVFLTVTLCGWLAMRSVKYSQWGLLICVFGLGALVHILTDFPVHASDAHRHFWPLSDWRFYSPVSYWEGDHHAGLGTLCEAALGIVVALVLWMRFPKFWVKILLGILMASYGLMFIGAMLFMTGLVSQFLF